MNRSFGLIVCFVFLQIGFLNAQQGLLDGSWYSNGSVTIQGNTNNYLGELKLHQKGKSVFGEFNYYFRDSLFKNKIEGYFDPNSHYFLIKTFPIILHSSYSTKTGVDCAMRGEFLLRVSRVGSYLAGKLIADDVYKYTCPNISFTFEKNSDTISPIEVAKQDSQIEEAKKIDTNTVHLDPLVVITQKQFEERPKDFFKEMDITSKTIDIELTDNGVIDYDSISVFFNNKLLLKKTMLTHRPINLTLTIDDNLPFNELGMFANNEGLIPPNTATLVITDGDNKY